MTSDIGRDAWGCQWDEACGAGTLLIGGDQIGEGTLLDGCGGEDMDTVGRAGGYWVALFHAWCWGLSAVC